MADSTKDEKPIKRAAQIILGSQAASRFTRTPITIEHPGSADDLMKELKKAGIKAYIEGGDVSPMPTTDPNAVTGEYSHDTGRSTVTANTANPTLEDIKRTLFHEDIHSLLHKAGYTAFPTITNQPSTILGDNPVLKAANAFMDASRGGNYINELPAYAGAFSQKQLPGITEGDRQNYLNILYKTMPPQLIQSLSRIIGNYNANPTASFGPLVPAGQ